MLGEHRGPVPVDRARRVAFRELPDQVSRHRFGQPQCLDPAMLGSHSSRAGDHPPPAGHHREHVPRMRVLHGRLGGVGIEPATTFRIGHLVASRPRHPQAAARTRHRAVFVLPATHGSLSNSGTSEPPGPIRNVRSARISPTCGSNPAYGSIGPTLVRLPVPAPAARSAAPASAPLGAGRGAGHGKHFDAPPFLADIPHATTVGTPRQHRRDDLVSGKRMFRLSRADGVWRGPLAPRGRVKIVTARRWRPIRPDCPRETPLRRRSSGHLVPDQIVMDIAVVGPAGPAALVEELHLDVRAEEDDLVAGKGKVFARVGRNV